MMETPQEREQRLEQLRETTKIAPRLRRAENDELSRQPDRVRQLIAEQKSWTAWAEILEDPLLLGSDRDLPRTTEARATAAAALRELVTALGVEVAADWEAN
jgi:hypothetical protein